MPPQTGDNGVSWTAWLRRILWFAAIWALSVGSLGLISYGLKHWIGPG